MRKRIFVLRAVIAAILFIPAFVFSLEAQIWQKLGETGNYINCIYLPPGEPDVIIVGTDFFPTDVCSPEISFLPLVGTGFKKSTDRGVTFTESKLEGSSVYDLIIDPEDYQKWYAAVRKSNRGGVAYSEDGGESWISTPLKCDATYQIMDLEYIPGPAKKFGGAAVNAGKGFIYTEDDFNTCRSLETLDISSRCIKASKADTNLLFMAGDNFHPGVFRSTDGGETWERFTTGIEGLRIHTVLPLSNHAAYVLCGADTITALEDVYGKGVYMSTDTGKTWRLTGCEGHKVFDLAQHPADDKYVAAACDSSGVWFSAAYGAYFKQASSGLPPNSSVRHVAVPDWEITADGFKALCAVYSSEGIPGKGLYVSERVITEINDEALKDRSGLYFENIYPQPFKDFVVFSWYNPIPQNLQIVISDMYGRALKTFSKHYSAGNCRFRWLPEKEISAGAYSIVIKSSAGSTRKAVLKTK